MVDYFITNTELDCVMLYLMVSLNDHKGHEHVTQSRQLLMGPRNFDPIDSFVIAQLRPRVKPRVYREMDGFCVPLTIFFMYHVL